MARGHSCAAASLRGMGRHWILLTGLVCVTVGCSSDPVRPFPSSPTFLPPTVDHFPVWSHDGRTIAYFRVFPSADGPPGVYVVSKWGGTPRLIATGSFAEFRFSPDDARLVGIGPSLQVVIIEIATGVSVQPFYANRFLEGPDWSPDGFSIVYARGRDFLSEPPDSGGLHIYDLRTGTDRAIAYKGATVTGYRPLWLPTNDIAFVDVDGVGRERLSAVDPAGARQQVLYSSSSTSSFQALYWYSRPATGSWGILFTDNVAPPAGGIFLVRPDGSDLTRMPPFRPSIIGLGEEGFSPNGEEWVHHGFDPADSLDVLFVSRMGDMSGASTRQLTRYLPPPGAQARPTGGFAATPLEGGSPQFQGRF